MNSISKYISELIPVAALIPGATEFAMSTSKELMTPEVTRLCNQSKKARNWTIGGIMLITFSLISIFLLTIAALGALVWPLIPTYSFAASCLGAAIGFATGVTSLKKNIAISQQLTQMAKDAMPTIPTDLPKVDSATLTGFGT